jgi:branched-chain amino acid transport system substrate-binding protein
VFPRLALCCLAVALSSAAAAQVKVGLMVSATGPTTAIGIPQKNTGDLLPRKIGDATVEYVQLDDGGDTTRAVQNIKKLIQEHNIDAMIGPSTTPNALAITDIIAEAKVPVMATVGTSAVVEPLDAKKRWVFKTTQNDDLIAAALIRHMTKNGVKTIGFIGFNDPYGENWYKVFSGLAEKAGIRIVASERYARTDTAVTGQVLKIVGAKPDAVLIAGSGTPAALPQKTLKERGYTGKYYQTHGVANADFLRVGGKDVDDTFLPAGPVLVADQLPATNPVRKSALAYVAAYEAVHGKGSVSTFGAHAWDAGLLMTAAIPVALKKARPGTAEFRAALRDALEQVKDLPGAHGIFSMSPTDHLGLDQRARVMVKIQNGTWKYQP